MIRLATAATRSRVLTTVSKMGYPARAASGGRIRRSSLPYKKWSSPGRRGTPFGFRVYSVAAAPLDRRSLDPPKEAHGFELKRREFVKEYDSDILHYVHKKTGAEVMSVVNDDENKCFGVGFRTPVSDSTGVPHILEHSVLCGSRKYPVKEPFVELLKGSLQTFLNASTYPDRTLYPVASCNLQDFYNLVDVYLDAVFFPNCLNDPQIFAQEGWHYEIDKETDPLTYKGVVFNEMKGAFSSPDSVHAMKGFRLLFPENTYRHESGGDPKDIPKLTFGQFKDFHDTYYHPSNAKIWFSGDDDPVKRLEILSEYLDQFEKKTIDSAIEQQPFFDQSKRIVETFAAGENDKSFVSLHWMLSEEPFDVQTNLAVAFLNYLMVGTTAAPLYKRLIDSELGEAVIGGGIEDSLRQPFFSIGLKSVDADKANDVERVIMDEIERLARDGFSQTAIDAAMNTIEFGLRENNTGRMPRGLLLLIRAMEAWNYDRDPVEVLKWEAPLQELKKQLSSGEDVFRSLLKDLLLKNKHKLILELHPDKQLDSKMKKEEADELAKVRDGMSGDEIQEQVKLTEALKVRQLTPDSPEDLKCIPTLKLSDIPKEITKIPTEVVKEGDVTWLKHDLFTNDILYFKLAMNLRSLPKELLPMVPLFCDCLTEMGTKENDFVQLTELIGQKTGGLSVSPFVSSKRGSREPVAKLIVSGKSMKDKIEDLMDIVREVLLSVELDNKERFKQMVLETKAGLEASLVSSGNRYVVSRMAAQQHPAEAVSEMMSGIEYVSFVRELVDRVDADWPSVLDQLKQCQKHLINTQGCIVNLTADQSTLETSKPIIARLLSALPSEKYPEQTWDVLLPSQNEAFTVPTQVNYVGKAVNLYDHTDYEVSGSSTVVTKHLFASWLWERVRVAGGAYGCSPSLDNESGTFAVASFRDPNILETVEACDGIADFLKDGEMDEDALLKAIIGAIGSVDAYQLPDAKGSTAMIRYFLGITDEYRQARRDELLSTTVSDFAKLGEIMEVMKSDKAKVVVVTSPERAEKINAESPGFFKVQRML